MRKKVYSIVCVFTAILLLLLCGCNKQPASTPAPSSSPAAQETATPTPEGGVVIDSPLVGQWVPIGVNGKGYMSFLADGTMVRFEERENAAPLIQEQRYEIMSENTFRMIHNNGSVSHEYEFEVINDGKTLNIYDPTVGIRMASEFYRIDDVE